jgi:hypothetical protein
VNPLVVVIQHNSQYITIKFQLIIPFYKLAASDSIRNRERGPQSQTVARPWCKPTVALCHHICTMKKEWRGVEVMFFFLGTTAQLVGQWVTLPSNQVVIQPFSKSVLSHAGNCYWASLQTMTHLTLLGNIFWLLGNWIGHKFWGRDVIGWFKRQTLKIEASHRAHVDTAQYARTQVRSYNEYNYRLRGKKI